MTLATLLHAVPVSAQQGDGLLLQSDIYLAPSRGRNVSVAERSRDAFEADGLRIGSFHVLPRLTTGFGFLDNVYSASVEPRADAYLQLSPSVRAESDWSRHSVAVSAGGQLQRYFKYSAENQSGWNFAGAGRLDLGDSDALAIDASVRRSIEPRYSESFPDAAARPVSYRDAKVRGTLRTVRSRARFTLATSLQSFAFDDVPSLAGGVIDQGFRDRTVGRLTGRVEYGLRPGTGLFVETGRSRINYARRASGNDRSADDTRILAGASLDLTSLIRGFVALGYVERRFDLRVYAPVRTLAADLKLEYFVTPLTTVTFGARRYPEDSVVTGSGAFVNTVGRLAVDHELLRNLIISLQMRRDRQRYVTIDRIDGVSTARGGIRYLANPAIEFGLDFSRAHRSSSGRQAGRTIEETRLLISTTLKR